MIRRNFLKVLALFGAKATLTATTFDETKIKAIELNECYVVGLQYYDGKDFNAENIKFLTLKSEPTNEYDENAIEVYSENLKIGYIPRTENKVISNMMRQGVQVVAKIVKFNPEDGYTHRIKVKLYQV